MSYYSHDELYEIIKMFTNVMNYFNDMRKL